MSLSLGGRGREGFEQEGAPPHRVRRRNTRATRGTGLRWDTACLSVGLLFPGLAGDEVTAERAIPSGDTGGGGVGCSGVTTAGGGEGAWWREAAQ